jgi:hypothetical protein
LFGGESDLLSNKSFLDIEDSYLNLKKESQMVSLYLKKKGSSETIFNLIKIKNILNSKFASNR